MIQFNLLPDIKLEYIKAARMKRLVVLTSVLVGSVSLALVIGLAIAVYGFQKQHMNALTDDIATSERSLEQTDEINKILTVQSQLAVLTGLHDEKEAATQLLPYLEQLTPTDVSVSSLTIDFEAMTMTISGAAESPSVTNKLASVNKYIDTLKFTKFTSNKDAEEANAFSSVVLSSFGRADKGASYTIDLTFDERLFSNTLEVKLVIPQGVTTRSSTESPDALFEPTTGTGEEQ